MLSLFKQKAVDSSEITFKTRVQQFWKWFEAVAPRFYQTIDAGKCETLENEVSGKVDELYPGCAWVFGPGKNGEGHSFTLSGEGNLHRQLLTIYWLSKAPNIPAWTFYSSRQPGPIRGWHMDIDDRKFDPLEFWITPYVNRGGQKIDITVWHPLFDKMQENDRWRVLFLFLDQILGEYGTQQYIGEIKHDSRRLADSMPLEELNEFLKRVQAENEWKKSPPGESGIVYRFEKQQRHFLRGDIIAGNTVHPRLINEYSHAKGELENPLKDTGADYVFVAFDATILSSANQVAIRGEIEDVLDRTLKAADCGRLLGGALGKENAYIDLMIFDGEKSIEIIKRILRDKALPSGSSINYFAKEKRSRRVVI